MTDTGRDRLRELLDAVLDEDNRSLDDMADGAASSPFHFSRLLRRDAGEPPVALRRRVMLERAAWQIRRGTSVTDAAWDAGYESVDGFRRAYARAFGRRPGAEAGPDDASSTVTGHWLPAPNGIHFHPPTSLWVASREGAADPVSEMMLVHDVDDVRHLIEVATTLDPDVCTRAGLPGLIVLAWDGPEESLLDVLVNLVWAKQVWLAAVDGHDMPVRPDPSDGTVALADAAEDTAARWLAMVRDIDRRGAWADRVVDALCDPPESFVIVSIVAHVLTYSSHRRQLARHLLRAAGVEVDDGDPIMWLRGRDATPT